MSAANTRKKETHTPLVPECQSINPRKPILLAFKQQKWRNRSNFKTRTKSVRASVISLHDGSKVDNSYIRTDSTKAIQMLHEESCVVLRHSLASTCTPEPGSNTLHELCFCSCLLAITVFQLENKVPHTSKSAEACNVSSICSETLWYQDNPIYQTKQGSPKRKKHHQTKLENLHFQTWRDAHMYLHKHQVSFQQYLNDLEYEDTT